MVRDGRLVKLLFRAIAKLLTPAPLRRPEEIQEAFRSVSTVGVLCAAGIGDAIMATPLFAAIKRCKPDARVLVIGTESTTQVFQNHPGVDRILSFSIRPLAFLSLLRLWVNLRQEKIDLFLAAQPANTIRHSLIAACSGANLRLKHSYDYTAFPERDFSFVYSALLPDQMERHRVELNLDLLRFLGASIPPGSLSPHYHVQGAAHRKIETLLRSWNSGYSSKQMIALHPGGLQENKKWPVERFVEIGQALVNRGALVCLVGGQEEKAICDTLGSAIASSAVLNFAGQLSLNETAALLKRCRLLLSNDTGIMHLATAVGTKVIAVFGPTDARHIGPFTSNAKVLSRTRDIRSVGMEEVLQTILEVWGEMPEIQEHA